jgi:low temperature requirement protein LtrA
MFGWLRGVVFGLKFFEKRTYCTAQFLALCLVVFLYVVLHAFTDLSIILPILIIAMVLDAIVPVVVAGFFWSSNSVPPIDSHYADERIQTFIVIAMGETVAAAGAARLSGVGVDLEGDFCVSSFLLS